jgi:SAM-dependent MidA family methyltransferase
VFFAKVFIMPTVLESLLKQRIAARGPMPVAEFMEACLYHPEHGYYTRGLNFSTTPARDFVTAPEISPLFGAALARAVVRLWQRMDEPEPFVLAEGGPGRGVLMRDILAELQRVSPACYHAARPVLVETSPMLRTLQQHTLAAHPQCSWPENWDEAWDKVGIAPLVFVGNELLDAFPVQPYVYSRGEWYRRMVEVDETDNLILITEDTPSEPPRLPVNWKPAEGAVWEASPARDAWLMEMRERLMRTGGAALLLDYGAAQLPPYGADTLQAVRGHAMVPVLQTPGESDITTHVPFADVAAQLDGTCTLEDLGPFLLAYGMVDMALQASPDEQNALQRLIHPAQMGTLFKVLCCTHNLP